MSIAAMDVAKGIPPAPPRRVLLHLHGRPDDHRCSHRENREKLIRSSLNSHNKNPLIRQAIGSIQALSWVKNYFFILIFLPITLYLNFESYIKSILILISVFCYLFVQKFLSNSLVDFSANLDPNSMIFDSMEFSSSFQIYQNP